ncbi:MULTISPECIES: hypothetical protein [Agromyces]|uniref:Uncharacterized protein n=1 Tax=Agromyces mediolanus TaxID=41986 RepID=A0A918CLR5_AGRME|nr:MULTISPECIES: hypothetical protein [Agromyces]MCD1570834.1 hypothetical protein [Agromyces mediolanus]GGR30419.1 hypothetical protein GCM10010196_25590 [Agromyces mediolanus]GLJ72355.1 hypothetical protein GCM10017583_16110 [Agromyces mediolanus]GLU91024.1 hypothetical protein Agsp01_32790 [Agromyces sp. NBRC 114283]
MDRADSVSAEARGIAAGWQILAGIVLAPLLMLLAGWVTATYLSDGMAVPGVLLAALLTAAAVVVAARWRVTGITAGAVVAATMLGFLLTGMVPSSRPDLGLNGIVLFAGSGLLTAAIAAVSLTVGLVRRSRS